MKKTPLFIAASALIRASCGGGSNNNQGAQSPETNDNGITEQNPSDAPKKRRRSGSAFRLYR